MRDQKNDGQTLRHFNCLIYSLLRFMTDVVRHTLTKK